MTTTQIGYGRTYKTRQGAANEAARWNASGDGAAYTDKQGVTETITADAVEVNGGWACAYTTTRTTQN